MGYRFQLDRLGSDPEFVFINRPGGDIYPAERLVGTDRELRLAAWVGTDGHAATAEIRPGPAHNVTLHLYKIADAMAQTERFLQEQNHPLDAVAQPLYNHETMGGHIHISGWYNGPLTCQMVNQHGLVIAAGKPTLVRANPNFDLDPASQRNFQAVVKAGMEMDLTEIIAKVHYLVGPLDHALFGAVRNQRWVNNPQVKDMWRIPTGYTPPFPDSRRAYLRIEYRYPSTFLHSPLMAYCYFGLAKLALLNWRLIGVTKISDAMPAERHREWNEYQQLLRQNEIRIQMGRPPYPLPAIPPAQVQPISHADWRKLVRARAEELFNHPQVVMTRDLRKLPTALATQLKARPKQPLLVQFHKWAALLNSSGRRFE